jgi:SOS response regulatory protein OraA/RecX
MIIKDLYKDNKDYIIRVNDKDIIIDENTIVKYNLYINKEIDEDLLNKIINSYGYDKNYNLALNYSLKYNKSKKAVYFYLLNKNIDSNMALKICDELENNKIINDYNLAKNYILTCIDKSYGKLMIIKKLNDLLINKEAIDEAIETIDYDAYYKGMNKYISKNKDKYLKFDESIRKYKIKNDLLKRGYTMDDLSNYE